MLYQEDNLTYEFGKNVLRVQNRIGDTFYDFIVCKIGNKPVVSAYKTTLGDMFSQNYGIFDLEEGSRLAIDMDKVGKNKEMAKLIFHRLRKLVD